MKKLSEIYKELGIDFTFPIQIKNNDGYQTYFENSNDFWRKYEYDVNGYQTCYEDSDGDWMKAEYDSNGKETYFENSQGVKRGFPRSKSCDGKVIEIDGLKYELKLTN